LKNPLLKKIAVLAAAFCWLPGAGFLSGASSTTRPKPKTSTRASSRLRPSGTQVKLKRKRVRHRSRRHRWSPWRISSFGEPAALDDPAGEDIAVRQVAIEALGNWNGSVVVVDPNDGRILSIVNQKLALESAFTPCSTFKPIVGLAGLNEGVISPQTKLYVGRRTRMNLAQALAQSNNQFFVKLGQMLGFRRVAEYAHEFGLGEKAGSDIPGEVPGRFPSATPKEGVGLMSAYGQNIEVTPLQMAAVISAIANGGSLYELQYPRTPEELSSFEPKLRRSLEHLAPYFPQLDDGLAGAVIYGTARLAYDPEEHIFGKTGTCSEDGARLGWFVSYSGEEKPKYVVVVLLRGGRQMFGPHAAEIAGRLYRDLRQRNQTTAQASHGSSASAPAHGSQP
jgi:cell division protein FtsI/penicillin-binding protein 2